MKTLLLLLMLSASLFSKMSLEESKELVWNMEMTTVDLYASVELTPKQTARVFREKENNGRYTGGSALSSAKGAYMFIRSTLNMLLKLPEVKRMGITKANWLRPRNQDFLFKVYYKINGKVIKSRGEEINIINGYMAWQAGSYGAAHLEDVIYGVVPLSKVSISSLYKNIPKKSIIAFEKYIYAKAMHVRFEGIHRIKITNYDHKRGRMTPLRFLRAMGLSNARSKYGTKLGTDEIRKELFHQVTTTLVTVWGKTTVDKINKILKDLKYD